MTPPPTQRRVGRPRADSQNDDKTHTRQQIIMAAAELFASNGVPHTRIADIAQKAGLRTPSLYYYFKNKEAIFQALMQQLISKSMHNYAQLEALQLPPDMLLLGWTYSDFQTFHHSEIPVARLFFQELASPLPHQELMPEEFKTLEVKAMTLVQQAIEEQLFIKLPHQHIYHHISGIFTTLLSPDFYTGEEIDDACMHTILLLGFRACLSQPDRIDSLLQQAINIHQQISPAPPMGL